MKSLASRVGSVLLAGAMFHGAMVACSGGDTESTAHAGTGGSGGAGSASTATGNATTGSVSAGSGSCSCAQSTTYDVEAKEFAQLPATDPFPQWVASLQVPGRTARSLLGTLAYAELLTPMPDPFSEGIAQQYVQLDVKYRGDTVSVGCGMDAKNTPSKFKSVRFVVPAAQ